MADSDVNEHYLNRVVEIAETAGVEATEDIVTGTGIKLVAKGARIDARFKERLLQHKLSKPLETSVRVVNGVGPRPIDKVAEALLDKHALLTGVCGGATARLVARALHDLRLSTPMESLLSVYAAQGPHKLEHAVGVSLLSAALYYDLPEGAGRGMHTLMLAGLMHDVGELYIDPAFLQVGTRLTPEQWKHLAAHPIIGSRVLRDMPGAGPLVAEAVLYHHERLDGFGYPHGLRHARFPMAGQVLALAEMLMSLIESGRSPGERVSIATRLVPGEFNRHLIDRVSAAAKAAVGSDLAEVALTSVHTAEELAAMVLGLGATLQRLREIRPSAESTIRSGGPALKELMAHVFERCERIHQAFSSTGLDSHGQQELRECLAVMEPQMHFEVAIVLREIEWRLREVKRETRLRSERLPAAEAAFVLELVERGKASEAKSASEKPPSHELQAQAALQLASTGICPR